MDDSSRADTALAAGFASLVGGIRWVLVGAIAVGTGVATLLVSAAPRFGQVFRDMLPPGKMIHPVARFAVDHTGGVMVAVVLVGVGGMFLTATARRPGAMIVVGASHVLLLGSFAMGLAVLLARELATLVTAMAGP